MAGQQDALTPRDSDWPENMVLCICRRLQWSGPQLEFFDLTRMPGSGIPFRSLACASDSFGFSFRVRRLLLHL